jgi:hypothetical protein
MARVFEMDLPPMEKLVLLAMADHARDDGTGCYPSVSRLAKKTSLSERGVQKVIRRLESEHFLASKGKSKGGRGVTVEYDLRLEKGEPGSGFQRQNGEPGASKRVNLSAEKGEPGSPESSGNILREPVAVRGLGAKHIETVEKPVQQSLLNELTTKKENYRPPWVRGELAKDLYQGIHGKKIANAFFDARMLNPHDRIAACVNVAVTTLVTARVARLKVLCADEIEKRAIAELLGGLATLELVKDFEARRRHTVQAVTRAVIGACVRMLSESPGDRVRFLEKI